MCVQMGDICSGIYFDFGMLRKIHINARVIRLKTVRVKYSNTEIFQFIMISSSKFTTNGTLFPGHPPH